MYSKRSELGHTEADERQNERGLDRLCNTLSPVLLYAERKMVPGI